MSTAIKNVLLDTTLHAERISFCLSIRFFSPHLRDQNANFKARAGYKGCNAENICIQVIPEVGVVYYGICFNLLHTSHIHLCAD